MAVGEGAEKSLRGDGIGNACDPTPFPVCTIDFVEFPIYGFTREGIARSGNIDLDAPAPDTVYTRQLEKKYYQMTDHLGNPRVVITDRLLSDVVGGTPGEFRADIVTYSNLYPYGMEQPGRYLDGAGYRYGYNGMEHDSAVAGDHYTTYFRQYDARLGRFWTLDPITHEGESPFAAVAGNPIMLADPSGAEGEKTYYLDPVYVYGKRDPEDAEVYRQAQLEFEWAENLKYAYAQYKEINRIYKEVVDHNRSERDNTTVVGKLSGGLEDLLQLGVARNDEFAQRLQEAELISELPGGSAAQAIARISEEGWSLEGGIDLALGVADIFSGGKGGKAVRSARRSSKLLRTVKPAGKLISTVISYADELTVTGKKARANLRKAMRGMVKPDQAAHHIIPWEAKKLEIVQRAARGGFNINGANNGMPLKRVQPDPQHYGSHPNYNRDVLNSLSQIFEANPNMSDIEAAAIVQFYADQLREKLSKLTERLN